MTRILAPAALAVLLALGAATAQEAAGDGDQPDGVASAAALLWGSTGWRRHVADLNGDGLDDLLYHSVATWRQVDDQPDGTARYSPLNSGLAYRVFESNGDGTFTGFPVRTALSRGHHCGEPVGRRRTGSVCSVIDVDADGADDLVIFLRTRAGRPGFDRVRILHSGGQGGFEGGAEIALPEAVRDGGGWQWAWADTNGDGLADIVNYSGGGRRVTGEDKDGRLQYAFEATGLVYRILESNGVGRFTAHPERRALPTGHHCWPEPSRHAIRSTCSFTDADGDGRSDLVIMSTGPGSSSDPVRLQVLFGTPGGRLSPGPERDLPAPIRAGAGWRWHWVQLNDDGRADILNFTSGARYRTSEEDRDGRRIDRFVSNGLEVQAFVSRADGTFTHVPPAKVLDQGSRCLQERGWRCDIADVNADGVADILTASPLGDVQVQAFLGATDGTIAAASLNTLGERGRRETRWTSEFADVNGDGRVDVVLLGDRHGMSRADDAAGQIRVLLSNGDGTVSAVRHGSPGGL